MKSSQLDNKLQAYLNGNLSESDKKSFEKEMMSNPELNHQVNQKRFEQQQAVSQKEVAQPSRKINWLPIVAILASILFLFQYLSKSEHEKTEVESEQSQQISEAEEGKDITIHNSAKPQNDRSQNDEMTKKAERAVTERTEKRNALKRNNKENKNQEVEATVIVERVNQIKSAAEEGNGKKESLGLEYIMLAKQLYTASDYPTGEELLAQKGKTIQNQHLHDGIHAYAEDQDMRKAIASLQKINRTKDASDYEIAKPYLAHAYFKLGDFPKAINLFDDLANNNNKKTAEDAEWFLAISLLSEYSAEEGRIKKLMQKMLQQNKEHIHFKDASYLKEDLEKISVFTR